MATVSVISHQLTLFMGFKTHQHADQNQIKPLPSVNDKCTYMYKWRERPDRNVTRLHSKNTCCSITVTDFYNATVCSDLETTEGH